MLQSRNPIGALPSTLCRSLSRPTGYRNSPGESTCINSEDGLSPKVLFRYVMVTDLHEEECGRVEGTIRFATHLCGWCMKMCQRGCRSVSHCREVLREPWRDLTEKCLREQLALIYSDPFWRCWGRMVFQWGEGKARKISFGSNWQKQGNGE